MRLAIEFGVGALVGAAITYLLIKHYVSSYLSEKGKNLATREDVEEITEKIEAVRSQYAVLIEESKARHQIRLAALDKRLQAHQEAFTLWRELMAAAHTDDIGKVVLKCQEWWEKNCVYLEPDVREAFVSAYSAANSHNAYVRGRADATLITENWARIVAFPNVLFAAVQLPALTELEAKQLGVTRDETNAKAG